MVTFFISFLIKPTIQRGVLSELLWASLSDILICMVYLFFLLSHRLSGSNEQAQTAFILRWVQAHIQDADSILRKPLLITEFGKSSLASGYSTSQRDSLLETVYSTIYDSAKSGGSCVGGLFWQLLGQGMDNMRDGYEIILAQDTSTASIITQQSNKLSSMNKSLKWMIDWGSCFSFIWLKSWMWIFLEASRVGSGSSIRPFG